MGSCPPHQSFHRHHPDRVHRVSCLLRIEDGHHRGTQTTGLCFGAYHTYTDTTEEYNGTAWSSCNDLATVRRYLAGCGTQSSGLSFGGNSGSYTSTTEEYNIDPTTDNDTVYDDGSFGTGAYTKGIAGLTPETTYRIRAYATNSAGAGYGATVQTTTAKATNAAMFGCNF